MNNSNFLPSSKMKGLPGPAEYSPRIDYTKKRISSAWRYDNMVK